MLFCRLPISGRLLALLALLAAPPVASAQDPELARRKLPAQELPSAPVIDGDLSDPVWTQAAEATRFSDRFNSNTQIDQTRVRLGYDQEHVYVAFHCLDSQPESIIAREIRHDASLYGDDTVTLILDPYRTRRGDDSNYFTTNALGTTTSYIAGGRARKVEWKGVWQCAARRTPDGWTAEMRIPWRILNYPVRSGPLDFGLNFTRHQERTKINSLWSNTGPQNIQLYAGDWVGLRLKPRRAGPEVSLLPFLTFQHQLDPQRDFKPGLGREHPFNLGLDVRAALTPELTAVGTLNADFSTVESAIAGNSFIRGERFIRDTRPFFLEGRDHFDATTGVGWGSAFYSNRIPTLDAGLKVFGRINGRENVAVFGGTTLDPRRSDLVARWSHELGPNSAAGAYLVHRDVPGDRNSVFALNETIRRGPFLIRSELTGSSGRDAGGMAAGTNLRWDGGRMQVGAGYTYVEPDFRAANGFVQFVDFHGSNLWLSHESEWREGFFRELDLYASGRYQNHIDGSFFRKSLDLGFGLETRSDWLLHGSWDLGEFETEHDNEFGFGIVRNVSNRRDTVGVNYRFGTRADRPTQYIAPSISRRVFGNWDVSVSSSLLYHTEDSALHIISLGREFDPYRVAGARVVIRDGRLSYFVSYRISGGRGMEAYFLLGDPTGFTGRTRTTFVTKLVFPVGL